MVTSPTHLSIDGLQVHVLDEVKVTNRETLGKGAISNPRHALFLDYIYKGGKEVRVRLITNATARISADRLVAVPHARKRPGAIKF